jgi:hypothetical protein
MKLIKKFKDFPVIESEGFGISSQRMYRTFFAVPIGTDSYGMMEFRLTRIGSTSMPSLEGSSPKEFENHNSISMKCDSEAYGEIFIVTFFNYSEKSCTIDTRDTIVPPNATEDDYDEYPTETIGEVIDDVKNSNTDGAENVVAFYHLKNTKDEYNFDLVGSMIESMKIDPVGVIKSLLGCSSDTIREDFLERFKEANISFDGKHSDLLKLRKTFPEIFKIFNDKINGAADTAADLTELGF